MELLSWSIYITTIPKQIADYKELFLIYGLRWRIEIIFKSWKSNLGFGKIHNVSNTIESHINGQVYHDPNMYTVFICPMQNKNKKVF